MAQPPTAPSASALEFENDVFDSASAALPFTFADPAQEMSGQLVRDPAAINYVACEAWKTLRISHKRRTGSVRTKNLNLFPSTHLDIILEVLRYLHPLELVQVERTDQSFHDLLNAPITESIWRDSFLVETHSDCPEDQLPRCPSSISGHWWTKLLFGPQICWECGQSNTEPDYDLWRRVCTPCAERNLVNTIPGYTETHELNSIVRRTMLNTDDYYGRGRFWRSDGVAIVAQYEACAENSGSEAALQFIEEQRQLVFAYRNLAHQCKSVRDSVLKQLIVEGFDECDVSGASYDIENCKVLLRKGRLTAKVWNRARPYILPYVIAAQALRLEREREVRVRLRKDAIIAAALMALRAPVPKLQHAYYPPPNTIRSFPPLADLLNEDSDDFLSLNNPQLSAALADARAFVEAWAKETQALLVSLLPGAHAGEPDFSLLDLATSVFCVRRINAQSTDVAIGWEEARAHLHWFQGGPEPAVPGDLLIEFNTRGSTVAAELAMLLGMDPETTTATDLDEADERFCCGICPLDFLGQQCVMSWRDCVRHVGSNSSPSHNRSSWLRLSPIAAADVRQREEPNDYSSIPTWSCALCIESTPLFEVRKYLEDHIRKTHLIDSPAEGDHFVFSKGSERPTKQPILLSIAGAQAARYRCNRCACDLPLVVKLLPKHTLRYHIHDEHSVEFSAITADNWTHVELLVPPPGAPMACGNATNSA
ncbi:F-box domain-containing protein [Mycena sanguinolenta]|uniref:F-box domain-containing protein n=1 Tax=Mycena sanguinolenta TaxID=230812 RepID=A0A8H6YFU2_9AGAR|nr:F-box domain-containing protein [Mycena sanguinolenta]